jgi:hypothetical protein
MAPATCRRFITLTTAGRPVLSAWPSLRGELGASKYSGQIPGIIERDVDHAALYLAKASLVAALFQTCGDETRPRTAQK